MAETTITCGLSGCNVTKTVDSNAMKLRIVKQIELSDDWFYLGANDTEGRPDDLFFDTQQHYTDRLNA